jgi:UPF0271 protein
MKQIDINCDMGEMAEALADGTQEDLMRYVSSANIACGGHAGNAFTMRATIEQATRHNVAIGAHPGYEDPANFGRHELQRSPEEIAESVYRQLVALDEVAKPLGARIAHVKPHGALYNQAARYRELAHAIAEGVLGWRTDIIMVGLAGSVMLEEFRLAGFVAAAEGFADRRYEPDGSLRARKFPDALLADPQAAAFQAVQLAREGNVTTSANTSISLRAQTICIHADTPGAATIAAQVHRSLAQAGISIANLVEQKRSGNCQT